MALVGWWPCLEQCNQIDWIWPNEWPCCLAWACFRKKHDWYSLIGCLTLLYSLLDYCNVLYILLSHYLLISCLPCLNILYQSEWSCLSKKHWPSLVWLSWCLCLALFGLWVYLSCGLWLVWPWSAHWLKKYDHACFENVLYDLLGQPVYPAFKLPKWLSLKHSNIKRFSIALETLQ